MTNSAFVAQLVEDLGVDSVRAVLEVFEKDVRRLTQVLRVAASADDPASFRRAAHGLAGAAGAVGATSLEQAARVNMTRADVRGEQLTSAADEMERLAQTAVAELGAIVAALPPAT